MKAGVSLSTGEKSGLGLQIAIELYSCDRQRLDDVEFIRQTMLGAAREAGAQIVTELFHRFSPHGVSGVVIITESHLAIHTWPEHGYAAVDLFTCGDRLASDKAIHHLRKSLKSKRVSSVALCRGPFIVKQIEDPIEPQRKPCVAVKELQETLLEHSDLPG